MPTTTVRNKKLRNSVTVIQEQPALDKLGKAGARLKLDKMLLAVHGQTNSEWQNLSEDERDVLRKIAREEDPAWGLSHQVDAIGALAEMRDKGALLQLSETARDKRADMRVQIAATHAIGEIGGEQVRPVLRALLEARAPEVRAQAARALAKAGLSADLAVLVAFVKADKTFASEVAGNAIALLRARLQQGARPQAGG